MSSAGVTILAVKLKLAQLKVFALVKLAKLATCVLTLSVGGSLRIAQQLEKGTLRLVQFIGKRSS